MRSLASQYHPNNNFWDLFQSFKDVDPFAKLYSRDKSPGKRISSMKMWAMVLIYDPESDFYSLPQKEEKVKTALERNHRLKLDLNELEELSSDFYTMTLNQADKSLMEWEKRMKERDAFLKSQSWSFDYYNDEGKLVKGTADQLDKMHGTTPKHYLDYEKIYRMVQELKIKEENSKKKNNVQELDV